MAETTDASACIGWLAAATSPIVTRTTCANCTAAHQPVQLPVVETLVPPFHSGHKTAPSITSKQVPFRSNQERCSSKVPFVSTVLASVYEIKLTALNRQQLIVTGRWKVTCGEPAPAVVY